MKIRVWVIALLLSIIHAPSKAQVEKQVEVTKSYIPQIEPTQKLKLEPDMSDTVRLKPEIDYTIIPRSIETSLSLSDYEAAKATFWEFNRPELCYIKAGVGIPLASVVDVYISNANPNTNYAVAYINHKGQYANIKNDYGQRLPITNTQNRVGGAAGVYLGEQILHAEVHYDIDYWSRYATNTPKVENPMYQTVSAAVSYGDQFITFNKWNFQLNIGAERFFNSEADASTTISGDVKIGGEIRDGKLITEVGYELIDGNYNYKSNRMKVSSIYSFTRGKFDMDLGAEYLLDIISSGGVNNTNHNVMPQIKAQYVARHKIQPYIHITGEIENNDYASLVQANPYIAQGAYLNSNSASYSSRVGASGVLGDRVFRYDLYADYTSTQNAKYWALVEQEWESAKRDNYYTIESGRQNSISINADCEYRPINTLSIRFKASATDWQTTSKSEFVIDKPVAKIYLGAQHTVRSFKYGLSADFESSRQTTLITDNTQEVIEAPSAVNIKAFVELKLKNNLSVFVEGENLANAEIYRWIGYREYGVGAMAGVRMQF